MLIQRLDMIKQSLWDVDSSTCFYSNDILSIPKTFEFIPIEDSEVSKALTKGLDQIEHIRVLFKDSLDKKNKELETCRKERQRFADRYNLIKKSLDNVLHKTLPRCKILIKFD